MQDSDSDSWYEPQFEELIEVNLNPIENILPNQPNELIDEYGETSSEESFSQLSTYSDSSDIWPPPLDCDVEALRETFP